MSRTADLNWPRGYSIPQNIILNWGELARSHGLLLRDWLGIGQRVGSGCVVHHLFFLSFIPLSLLFITIVIVLYFAVFSITELFLSQPLVYLFLILFLIPPRGSEQMVVWYLVAD